MAWQLWVASAILKGVSYLMKRQDQRSPKKAEIRKLTDMPMAAAGTPVPLVYGTDKVEKPPLVWWGNAESVRDNPSSDRGWEHYDQRVGLQYALSLHVANNNLRKIWVGDKLAWSGDGNLTGSGVATPAGGWDHRVQQDTFFGGQYGEGELVGYFTYYQGDQSQSEDPYLNQKLGSGQNCGYRGVAYVVFWEDMGPDGLAGFEVGLNEEKPPPFFFEMEGFPDALNGGTTNQVGPNLKDANPAEVLYDILTRVHGGAGVDSTYINTTQWAAVAATLYSEELGISLSITEKTPIDDVVSEILRHIDGVLYLNPLTAQYDLKLLRNDYDVGSLTTYTDADIVAGGITNLSRKLFAVTPDEVRLEYIDRASDYSPRTGFSQRQSIFHGRGGSHRQILNLEYPYIRNRFTAANVATRQMSVASKPLLSATVIFNRSVFGLMPGDLFVLDSSEYSISEVVMRVVSIDYGSASDSQVTIECLEDAFSREEGATDGVEVSTGELVVPSDITTLKTLEAPRWVLKQSPDSPVDVGKLFVMAAKPAADDTGFLASVRKNNYDTARDVVWTLVDGSVAVTGRDIVKTGGTMAWDAGAVSDRYSFDCCFVQFATDDSNTYSACGLSNTLVDEIDLDTIEFAFLLEGGSAYVYESGVQKFSAGAYTTATVWAIVADGPEVRYYKDGVLVYTSAASPTYPLRVDVSLFENDASIVDVIFDESEYVGASGEHKFSKEFLVETEYLHWREPYDTSVGLRIKSLSSPTLLQSAFDAQISAGGRNLILVGDELLSYTTWTDLGSGVYRLNNVWRGLLDTVPVTHAVNTRGWLIMDPVVFIENLNNAPVQLGDDLFVKYLSSTGASSQSELEVAGEPLTCAGRTLLPYPAASVKVAQARGSATNVNLGDLVRGFGHAITRESISATFLRRDRHTDTIVRGDEADEPPTDSGVDYTIEADAGAGYAEIGSSATSPASGHLQPIGSGTGSVKLRTDRPDGAATLSSYQSREIPAHFAKWRQLLLNPSFEDGLTNWETLSGTPTVSTAAAYEGSNCLHSQSDIISVRQDIDVAALVASGDDVLVSYKTITVSGGSATVRVRLQNLTSGGSVISTVDSTALTPSGTTWNHLTLKMTAVAATTAKLRILIDINYAETGVGQRSGIDNIEVRLAKTADFASLTNPGFNSGLTGWTTLNATTASSGAHEGSSYLYATDDIVYAYQDYAIPGGYGAGDIVMLSAIFKMIGSNPDTAILTLDALNASDVSLLAASTGTFEPGSGWEEKFLYLQIPSGATKIRVRYDGSADDDINICDIGVDDFVLKFFDVT